MDHGKSLNDVYARHRSRLFAIAYRMLGSRADADDMLQETWLRWCRAETEAVQSPQAWLTTTITRLCIDRLRRLRREREAYSGPWLPEPLVGEAAPADRAAELASDVSVALLVVLERLAPEERAAFLLHEAFDCDYPEIAAMLGRTQANTRQIVHRARERVRRERPRFTVSEQAHRQLLERFVNAVKQHDSETLLELFAEEASWTADGGGKVRATSKPVTGRERVARLVHGVSHRFVGVFGERATFELVPINGVLGVLMRVDGVPRWALSLETDGAKILAGYNILNPEKLSAIAPRDR